VLAVREDEFEAMARRCRENVPSEICRQSGQEAERRRMKTAEPVSK
jgi:hypothetical protein